MIKNLEYKIAMAILNQTHRINNLSRVIEKNKVSKKEIEECKEGIEEHIYTRDILLNLLKDD